MSIYSRRSFIKFMGATAALPLVSPAIGLAAFDKRLKVAQETRLMMGTLVTVTVLDESAAKAQSALAQGFGRMAAQAPLFDRRPGPGPLAQLNREARLAEAPPQLKAMLDACQALHNATGGAFDVTVAPAVDVFKRSTAQNRLPSRQELDTALGAIGGLRRDGSGYLLVKEGAGVTLDGVAKGHVADEGLRAIAATGARHALINAGGDVAVLGDKGGKPWRVAVADPLLPSRGAAVVELSSGAVATSGNYEVFFDKEKIFHHVIDPATGVSPKSGASASVLAPSGLMADALSTACLVLGPTQAMTFLKTRPGCEGLVFTRTGQRYTTPGFWSQAYTRGK